MGTRPLRRYYDEAVVIEVAADLGSVVGPWHRHRARLLDELAALSDEQWTATTRCTAWDARDVVNHLVTADGFWTVSLLGAAAGSATSHLVSFDPETTPAALVAAMPTMTPAEVLDQLRAATDTFATAVDSLGEDDWSALGESPMGHVPARLALAHALWDSWLHERDILVPLGLEPPVEPDELLVCTWYTLALGGAQGGLLGDPSPVGPGLDAPIDVTLGFDELPEALRVVVGEGVRIERAPAGADVAAAGSTVALVETTTGRRPPGPDLQLPTRLAEHLDRACQVI